MLLAGDDTMSDPGVSVRLGDLAHCRSGDKGNRANVGVVADRAEGLQLAARSVDRRGRVGIPPADGDRRGDSL